MKIAIASKGVDPIAGGGETYVVNLAKGLLDLGHEVQVLVAIPPAVDPGIPWTHLAVTKVPRTLTELRFAMKVQRAIQEGDFDVSVGMGKTVGCAVLRPGGGLHSTWFEQDLMACANRWQAFIKRVLRRLAPQQRISFRLENLAFQAPTLQLIVANSEWVRQDIIRKLKWPPDRIVRIYNGVDHDRFRPSNRERLRIPVREELGLPENEVVLLFAANNFRLKGLPVLLRALEIVRQRRPNFSWRLVVAGKGTIRVPTTLRSRVTFAGRRRDMERIYAASDVLVHPTFYDPFSNTCLEALAAGLPIVTTSWCGTAELLHPGENGFVVRDPADTAALAEAILAFANSERLRAMKDAAPGAVKELTCMQHAKQMEEVLARAARNEK